MIESLVAVLLVLTIGYCAVLNWRLKRLRADEQALKVTISELITATEIAERAVEGLKSTARDCEATLGHRLKTAEKCCAELDRQLLAGDGVLSRLSRVVMAARTLNDVVPAEIMAGQEPARPPAPDPHALAAAAHSFSERMRERVGVLAA
jgi:hypothetical protein